MNINALYGSKATPKEVFGEGNLLNLFHTTMEHAAPACWELNQTCLDIWDPTVLSHNWVMPDNFHVKVKVMTSITERVHYMNEPHDVTRYVNAPKEAGRSISANMVHSIDGMIVREMLRRCMYDPNRVDHARILLESEKNNADVMTDEDLLVQTLWQHYEKSGYLSARIIDVLNLRNVGHITDRSVVLDLLNSLPWKPFQIIPVHD